MKLKLTHFSLKNFIRKNVFHKIVFSKNLFLLLFLWFKGFDSDSILSYNLNFKNYHLYLPDSIRYKITLNTNSGYWPIFHDKLIFYNYVKDKLVTPEIDYYIFNGHLYSISGDGSVKKLVESGIEYVLKPLRGGRGQGITFITKKEDNNMYFQNELLEMERLSSYIKKIDAYGIFKYYRQHNILNKIYPKSMNTIRMVTMRDITSNNPFIFVSLLRIGWSGSVPFDNYSQGGLVCMIDNNSGTLSNWKRKKKVNGLITIEEGNAHPDTKTVIQGIVIPNWEKIKNDIIMFLTNNPFFNYVGWDILVTEDSYVVIEANHNPDIDLVQIHKPLLSDKRAVDFFKNKKIYE